MIELHTRIFCQCGQRYYHQMIGNVPLSKNIDIHTDCPFCGNKNTAEYEFDAEFACKKWYKPWQKHYIADHFSKNEGCTDEELYPRQCKCGKTILLKQRRC